MLSFRLTPHSDDQPFLARCSGTIYDEGDCVACAASCLAHFDANVDTRDYLEATGNYYNPYPNSVLSAVAHLPGTISVSGSLIPPNMRVSDLQVFRNTGFFSDTTTGDPITVYVVLRAIGDPDLHFAAAFATAAHAYDFMTNLFAFTD